MDAEQTAREMPTPDAETIAREIIIEVDLDWELFEGRTELPRKEWPSAANQLVAVIAAALREAAAPAWRPIETAPRDGTWIFLWRGPSNFGSWEPLVIARWCVTDEASAWMWPDDVYDVFSAEGIEEANAMLACGDCYEDAKNFTHWMPLPSPPAQGGPA